MKQDRFLLGILIFIGLLVVFSLGLFFIRQNAQTYGPGDTPAGVVRNYSLAVQNMDFERAYGYLADKPAKPGYDAFRLAFLNRQLDTTSAAVQIGATRTLGEDESLVEVTIVFSSNEPFSRPWSSSQNAALVKQGGIWKLTLMPNPYWGWDWYTPTPSPIKG